MIRKPYDRGYLASRVRYVLANTELRANPGVNLAAEVLKAEAWLTTNPKRAPKSDVPRFLHSWLSRADREVS